MKKIIVLLVAILTCLTAVFSGCGESTGYSNGLTNLGGEVVSSSNGGFTVVKGDYLYFINGVETHTSDNTYGTPVTGALVRVALSDLANPADAKTEMVIPALFVAGDFNSGFYIFGNDVYYASPVTEKNKEGVVENTKLDFVKTSIDGKNSVIVKTVDSNTTEYRFVEAEGVVYLILKTVNEDSETVIQIVNTATKAVVHTTEKIESVIFAEGNSDTVYYTRVAHDDVLDKDESFNELHRVNVKGEDEILLSGKGMYGNEEGDLSGFGVSGAKIALIKDTATHLYFSLTYVDTSITTVNNYCAVEKAQFAKVVDNDFSANQAKIILLNKGTASAATVFASTSYYLDLNNIVYLDSQNGLVKYDYQTTDPEASDCRIRLFYDKDLVGYTVKFWNEGYLYVVDSSNYYYRVNVNAILNGEAGVVEKVNFLANSTSWYTPEVVTVDGKDYFISVYTASPYNSFVYVSDIAANSALDEDAIKDIQESTEEQVRANFATSISLISDSAKETFEKYIEDTFKTDDEE